MKFIDPGRVKHLNKRGSNPGMKKIHILLDPERVELTTIAPRTLNAYP
ncbi:hypothetical protein [Pararhodonellum marinum]|nr:hypothetical protein [Pararhodonellum marinum]